MHQLTIGLTFKKLQIGEYEPVLDNDGIIRLVLPEHKDPDQLRALVDVFTLLSGNDTQQGRRHSFSLTYAPLEPTRDLKSVQKSDDTSEISEHSLE